MWVMSLQEFAACFWQEKKKKKVQTLFSASAKEHKCPWALDSILVTLFCGLSVYLAELRAPSSAHVHLLLLPSFSLSSVPHHMTSCSKCQPDTHLSRSQTGRNRDEADEGNSFMGGVREARRTASSSSYVCPLNVAALRDDSLNLSCSDKAEEVACLSTHRQTLFLVKLIPLHTQTHSCCCQMLRIKRTCWY